jgi:two-component system KDP operon response regulator KdpE
MNDERQRILVIDDEIQIRRFLRFALEAHGYRVYETETGQDGLLNAAKIRPDLIILDLGLPDMPGQDVLRSLREWTQTPVIILSVHDTDKDKVLALDSGADDYLTKPFSVEELMARMRTAMRHSQPTPEAPILTFGDVQIDFTRRLVTKHGETLKLTPTEYALFKIMASHAGRVLTHQQILREVWGTEYINETHYLRVYFAQLRQKLEDDPALPKLLMTEPGVGYRLVVE